ncbi:MAG: glycosyltransferase family 4 protein [Ancrocorticia sp.]
MHVLIVAQQWSPERGIVQRRMQWITNALIARGHTVAVLTAPPHYPFGNLLSDQPEHGPYSVSRGPSGEVIWRGNFRPHNFQLRTRVIDQAVIALTSLRMAVPAVRRQRPDIIVATAPPLPAVSTAHLLARVLRVPFVVDLRDAWPDLSTYISSGGTRTSSASTGRRVFSALVHLPAKIIGYEMSRAAGVVTTTASLASVLDERWGVPTLHVSNLRAWKPRPPLESPPAAQSDRLEVLYTGTVGRAQGLANALDALELLRERGASVHLSLVGSGAQMSLLRREAARRDLPVTFCDTMPREEVMKRYEEADTLLVHLEDWEPLQWTVPSKLYEAIGSGRHVTFVGAGDSADMVRASRAGDTVPPRDPRALAQLWEGLARERSRLNVGARGADWLASLPSNKQTLDALTEFLEELA